MPSGMNKKGFLLKEQSGESVGNAMWHTNKGKRRENGGRWGETGGKGGKHGGAEV